LKKLALITLALFVLAVPVALAFSGSGSGTVGNPFEITNCTQLQEIQDSLTANYELVNNVDCTFDTQNPSGALYNGGLGFNPIGNASIFPTTFFRGNLSGNDFNITGLHINRPSEDRVGLFGKTAFCGILDVGVLDANVTGDSRVGALIGDMDSGTRVDGSHSSGSVSGRVFVGGLFGIVEPVLVNNTHSSANVGPCSSGVCGGLMGRIRDGLVLNSFATGNVSGGSFRVGGLIGIAIGTTVKDSYATGNVIGNRFVGGLVGSMEANSIINRSHANGTVSGGQEVGGLVGKASCCAGNTIENSFANGDAIGSSKIGGLVGAIQFGDIYDSFATGAVESNGNRGGGLVGSLVQATINRSFATGNVTGRALIGGLVGRNNLGSRVENSNASGNVVSVISPFTSVGGLVGQQISSSVTFPVAKDLLIVACTNDPTKPPPLLPLDSTAPVAKES